MNSGRRISAATRSLRAAAHKLRVFCPTNHPVRVERRRPNDGNWGDCLFVTKGRHYYQIRIAPHLDSEVAVWALVHEWAHAMSWPVHHGRHPLHGPHFGIAYSECYSAIYDD